MLVFLIKQLFCLKRAILGRRQPHQLAAGVALGVCLGMIPHGNLVALSLLLLILSVRINHGMAALVTVATSVIAARLDAHTHGLGKFVLTHPDLAHQLAIAWQWPIIPWTDLNNTVVMGGLVIGSAAFLPAYLIAYPIFHYLAPPANDLPVTDLPATEMVDPMPGDAPDLLAPVDTTPSPRPVDDRPASAAETEADASTAAEPTEAQPVDAEPVAAAPTAGQVTVDTRIEVVRLTDAAAAKRAARGSEAIAQLQRTADEISQQDQPMSEALNYLLRQLRQSRQGRAA